MGATARDHYDAAFGVDSGEVDPYACYEELRRHGPLVDLGDGRWFTTGYAIGMEALRNNALGVDMERVGRDRGGADWRDHPSLALLESTLLARNPPDHGVLRKAVNHAFAPPAVAAIEAQVKDTIDRLLGELAEQDHPDFIRDFADPLPVSVIGPILGIPSAARADFQSNTLQFNLVFEREMSEAMLAMADEATVSLLEFVDDLVASKRRHPGDDLTSQLIEASDAGLVDAASISPLIFQVFNASYQTTASMLGNGMAAVVDLPDTWEDVWSGRTGPDVLAAEFLRFDAPVQVTGRHALRPLVLDGRSIEVGETVIVGLGAANRDPERFEEPAVFRAIDRSPPLSFGWGIHKCLGAHLATLEARWAIGALSARFDVIEPEGPWVRWPTANMRGFARMPIQVHRRQGSP